MKAIKTSWVLWPVVGVVVALTGFVCGSGNKAAYVGHVASAAWQRRVESIFVGGKVVGSDEAIAINEVKLTEHVLPVVGTDDRILVCIRDEADPDKVIAVVIKFGNIGTVQLDDIFRR